MMKRALTLALVAVRLSCELHSGLALTASDTAICGEYPDPHYTTFHGNYYDFHGGCDTILIASEFLTIHTRTSVKGGWAGVDNAAVRLGGSSGPILEVRPSDVLLDGAVMTTPPATIGGNTFTVSGSSGSEEYRIDLGSTRYVEIERTYGNTLRLTVQLTGDEALDVEGMCGKWTASAPNNRVGRDGTTVFTNGRLYGEEWEVDIMGLGDPDLFEDAAPTSPCNFDQPHCLGEECECGDEPDCCTENDPQCQFCDPDVEDCDGGSTVRRRLMTPDEACADVPDVRGARENCVYDVFTTGDFNIPNEVSAYTDPIPENPETPGTTSNCGFFYSILEKLFGWFLRWLFGFGFCPS